MALQRRIYLPTLKIIPEILPRRLHRTDFPGYLLSRTFERRFGEEFPRREVLLKLAASAAAIALPVRWARAISPTEILSITQGYIRFVVSPAFNFLIRSLPCKSPHQWAM